MSHGKQFTLYSVIGGPNGWYATHSHHSTVPRSYTVRIYRKVDMVLRELGLTFETKFLDLTKNEQKAPEFTKFNPNGRIPALIDHHNNDFVVW